jgi:hypothetical protein
MFDLRIATVTAMALVFLVNCSQTTPQLPDEALRKRQEGWVKEAVVLQPSPTAVQPAGTRRLKPGTPLRVESSDGSWYLVKVNDAQGDTGWISAQHLSFEPLSQQWLMQKEHEWSRQIQLSEEQLDWEQARQLDTISAYAQYLEKYAEVEVGRCAPEAIQRLEELLWPLVEMDHTFESYVLYLALFSRGQYALYAKEHMRALVSTPRQPDHSVFWEPLRPLRHSNLSAQRELILLLRHQGRQSDCTFDFGRS